MDRDGPTVFGDCGWMDCPRPLVWPCKRVHHPKVRHRDGEELKKDLLQHDFCKSRHSLLFLFRNKDVQVNHRDFWYATYTLYSVSETVENDEKLNDAASGSSGGDQGSSHRQLTGTMVSFLKPVLKQIIMAGKSMQLLRNLDRKETEQSERSSRGQRLFWKWHFFGIYVLTLV